MAQASKYALDQDGDGRCATATPWNAPGGINAVRSWLRPMIRTFRSISKVYLPLFAAQFEFLFNHRHHNRWNRALDVLQAAF
ncbi:MAG: hypothetical protein AB1649_29200 [Chloroflexota bacterium]